jgi:subtilisin family serine protease
MPGPHRIALGLCLVVVLGLPGVTPGAEPASPRGRVARVTQPPPHVPDEILVRFRDRASPGDIASAHARAGGRTKRTFKLVKNLAVVKVPRGRSVKEAIRAYLAHADVLYAEPNYRVRALNTPNDPRFGSLWGLRNTGQFGGLPGADIGAPAAWNVTTGSQSVVVVVIDTGIDYTHPDLAPNMFRNEPDCDANGTDDDGNGFVDDCFGVNQVNGGPDPMDDHSHGTHVAGTIGAVGDNAAGVVGVNWRVRLMACKFMDASGSGTIADAIGCMDYVTTMRDRGVDIVATNNSWHGGGFSLALYDAIDAHRQRGILFVAAAGNNASDNDTTPHFPSGYDLPNVIAVSATTPRDALAGFSNYGRRTVHLGAPGQQILSTTPGGAYETFSGTSMAAPHVAGVAALLAAQDPSRDWRAIKNLILAGGDANGALAATITGRRLNAHGALTCSDSTVLSRLHPVRETINGAVGEPIDLAVLHIDCASPNGSVAVTISPGGGSVVLEDDGAGVDYAAGDGIYSGQWVPGAAGTYTLAFPDGSVATVEVLNSHYEYVPTAFDYRAITGTRLDLGDEGSAEIVSPFPIAFGGGTFDRIFVDANGFVNFTGDLSGNFIPQPIPTSWNTTLVAPLWSDWVSPGGDRGVFWQVIGTAPNRELVIDWNVGHWACSDIFPDGVNVHDTVRFQVVFFEGKSDILFNYADVHLVGVPGGCTFADRGGAASVGIQTAADLGTEFSFETKSLNDGMALLWTIPPPGISVTPTSRDFGNVLVGGSADRRFTVRNAGAGTLVGSVTASAPFSIVSGGALSLEPGRAQDVTVRFSPTTLGPAAGSVTFDSNAGNVSRAVTGIGTRVPILSVNGGTVPITVAPGATVTVTVRDGPGNSLDWVGLYRVTDSDWDYRDWQYLPAGASDATLTFTMPTEPGRYNFRFFPDNGFDRTAVSPTVTILPPPPPVLSAISPARVAPGTRRATLTATGEHFVRTSVVRVNGRDRVTTFVSATELQAVIPATDLAKAGTAQITVFTPEPGGGTSDPLALTIGQGGVLQFSSARASVFENVAPGTAVLTVKRAGANLLGGVTVDYTATGGTAVNGADYALAAGTLTFGPGETSKPIAVTINDDGLANGDRTVIVTLSNPQGGGVLGTRRVTTLTILDDEQQVSFSAALYTVDEPGGSVAITLHRSGPRALMARTAFTVPVTVTGGTAVPARDYVAPQGPVVVSFAKGQTTARFRLTVLDDTLADGKRQVDLSLGGPTNGVLAGPLATAVLSVGDNDQGGVMKFARAGYSVSEGRTAAVTVVRTGTDLASDVSVDYAVTGGTAVRGVDFTLADGTLTFQAGQTRRTISIPTARDFLAGEAKTIVLGLGNARGGGAVTAGPGASTTVTINDVD